MWLHDHTLYSNAEQSPVIFPLHALTSPTPTFQLPLFNFFHLVATSDHGRSSRLNLASKRCHFYNGIAIVLCRGAAGASSDRPCNMSPKTAFRSGMQSVV